MKSSQSLFVEVRGLRYHVRSWGREDAPKLFMVHGWMDVSASFQFLVDALAGDWHVLAPDWRGYGHTQWSGSDTYWFGDFLGDLDQILNHFQPDSPVDLIAHSMGANVACVYAGIRPERIRRLVNIDAYGAKADAEQRLDRYRSWIKRLNRPLPQQTYSSWEELERRLMQAFPRIPAERIAFVARHWAVEANGSIVLRQDPAHGRTDGMDISNHLEDAMAAWRSITAPTLILLARQGGAVNRAPDLVPGATAADRFGCFRHRREVWFEDTGHMMHLERPDEMAPVIESFITDANDSGH